MRRSLLLAVPLLLPLAAQAQDYASQGNATPAVVSVNREFYAAFDGQDTNYKETLPADVPGHDREQGWTPGFGVGARWMGQAFGVDNVFASIDYHRQSGNLTYIGTISGTNTPLDATSGLITNDVVGELGRGFLISPRLLITPVIQAGYHSWHRNLGAGNTEDYSHVLLGAAVRADYALTPRMVASLRLGVAGMIDPKIDIHYQGDYNQGLGGSAVLQAGGKIDYALTPQVHIFAAADAQHFSYGRSKGSPFGTDQIIFEPDSTTTQLVVGGGVAYAF
jgi:hypothetical protein